MAEIERVLRVGFERKGYGLGFLEWKWSGQWENRADENAIWFRQTNRAGIKLRLLIVQ